MVDTDNFIRQALDHLLPDADKVKASSKRTNEALTAKEREACLEIALTDDCAHVVQNTRESCPTWRTFARMLFEDYGWSLSILRMYLNW